MASVLNRCRGVQAKNKEHRIAMPDDEFAVYLSEVQGMRPKGQRRWKRRNEKSDGSTQTIRYDGEGFYTQWLNQRVRVLSVSQITELARGLGERELMTCQVDDYMDERVYHNAMDQMIRETHTGNHRPRNHPVAIPTTAGEPVRG